MVKLFVVGFPKGREESWFRELFSQYGVVTKIAIVKNEELLKNLGYGFITMEDRVGASRAIVALNDSFIDGNLVNVRIAQ